MLWIEKMLEWHHHGGNLLNVKFDVSTVFERGCWTCSQWPVASGKKQ